MKQKVLLVFIVFGLIGYIGLSCSKETGKPPAVSKTKEPATAPKGAVLAKIDGKVITLEEFEGELNSLPEYTRSRLNTKEAKKKQLDKMIDDVLLMEEAAKRNLDNDPDIQKKLENYRKRLLSEKLYQVIADAGAKIPEEEIKKYYDEHKDQYEEKERIRASQIMIMVPPNSGPEKEKEAKAKAEQALKRAKKGEDFTKLAQEFSEGPMAAKGGDLGYFSKGRMMPEFENVAFSLKNIGDISDIVKTQFGYHIIKLTDRKPARMQSLDEVRERIVHQLESIKRREVRQNLPQELRQKVKIEIHDEYLKDEPGAAPSAAPGMPPGMPPGAAPGMAPGTAPGIPQGTAPGVAPGNESQKPVVSGESN